MNEKEKVSLRSRKISLLRLRDFCKKRKGICGAVLGGLAGALAGHILYVTQKQMPEDEWILFVTLLFLVSILLLFVTMRWRRGKEKEKKSMLSKDEKEVSLI